VPRPNPIKAAAAAQGRSIADVADALGISRHTFYAVARGVKEPWPKLRRAAAAELGVSEHELFPDAVPIAS